MLEGSGTSGQSYYWLLMARIFELALFCAGHYADNWGKWGVALGTSFRLNGRRHIWRPFLFPELALTFNSENV